MKSHYRSAKIFIAVLVIAGAIIFLDKTSRLEPFKEFSYRLFAYPQYFFSRISFNANGAFKFISEIRNSREYNSVLVSENNRLKREISELKEIKYENGLLKSALNLPVLKEHRIVAAVVVGKDPYGFSSHLVINRGSDSGLAPGMDAIGANGFFFGRISEVNLSSSKIRTIMDSGSSISAIDQESRARGIVKNDLNLGLIFDMVSQDEKVETGDSIITSPAENNSVPEIIAQVISVEKHPNKPFQTIKLMPLADMKNIERVFILIN